MLRHLDPKHRFFSKGYESKQKLQRVADADHADKKDIMRKMQSDLEGMPTLKGSNPRAKTSVYNALNKPKKPTRKEALARRPDFQALLQQDELQADLAQQLVIEVPTALQIASNDAPMHQPEVLAARGDAVMNADDEGQPAEHEVTPTKKGIMALRRRDRTPRGKDSGNKKK